MFQEELAKIPSTLYVLKEAPEKRVLGYSCFWSLSGELQLVNIAVHPDLRGQGLGRRLVNHLLLEAESREAEKIFLEVRPSNRAAIGLYERLGFKVLYRRPRLLHPGRGGCLGHGLGDPLRKKIWEKLNVSEFGKSRQAGIQ